MQSDCKYIVDIDLSKFLDTISKDRLMYLLKGQMQDRIVLKLINRYLHAGMMKGDQLIKSENGTPQGSPLSPLLSNIYLDQIDKRLEQRGIRFVRYADDIQIYTTSLRSAHRVMDNTMKLFESKKMGLKVNREKSAVRRPYESKFLGYTF